MAVSVISLAFWSPEDIWQVSVSRMVSSTSADTSLECSHWSQCMFVQFVPFRILFLNPVFPVYLLRRELQWDENLILL